MGGNKHNISTNDDSGDGEPPGPHPRGLSFPPPLWRLRPPLATSGMVLAIKNQIIPRLALAFRSSPAPRSPSPLPPTQDISQLLGMVLSGDDRAAEFYVERLAENGTPVSSLLLELLAPTARRLGEMWERDTTDFVEVTLAVSRLQCMMRQLVGNSPVPPPHLARASALLTTVGGDQHCFGLFMAAEFFRRAGWNLCMGPFASQDELEERLQQEWLDIVGFSVSSDRSLTELAAEIRIVRRWSRNRKVGIVLGGPLVGEKPELAAAVGADMVSVDVTIAPRHAHALVEVMKGRN